MKIRFLAVVAALALCVPWVVPTAAAAALDLDHDCSLTIVMEYNGAAIQGVGLTIYKVASAEVSDHQLRYVLTGDFSGSGADLTAMTLNKNLEQAALLLKHATDNGLAGVTRTTDASGNASFTPLETGLYLVAQTGSHRSYKDITPFLISIPVTDTSGTDWLYDITSHPKTEPTTDPPTTDPPTTDPPTTDPPTTDPPTTNPPTTDPPTTDPPEVIPSPNIPTEGVDDEEIPIAPLPQTSVLRWPVPVLACCGLVLFGFGWAVYKKHGEPQ